MGLGMGRLASIINLFEYNIKTYHLIIPDRRRESV
jgi:hypothetical protein